MTSHLAIVAVGSNIDPEANVRRATEILSTEQRLLGAAEWRRTKPVGFQDQADFLNGAFYIETDLGMPELKSYLMEIEKRLGRVKGPIKSGPRTMDLDIVVFDGDVVHDDFRTAPYVREPVLELAARFGIELRPKVE